MDAAEEQRQLDAKKWKVFLDGTRVESMTPTSGLWQNGAARNLEALSPRTSWTDTRDFRNCAELYPSLNQLEILQLGDRDPGLLTSFPPLTKLNIIWVKDVADHWKAIKTHHATTIKQLSLWSIGDVTTEIMAATIPYLIHLERLELLAVGLLSGQDTVQPTRWSQMLSLALHRPLGRCRKGYTP